jgi:glycosyltransferase involved in cell wall biosynthesis
MSVDNFFILVTGTDPKSRKGGIGYALPGHLAALKNTGLDFKSIPTYHPATRGGRWWPWLSSFPKLWYQIKECPLARQKIIVYSHAGAGISLFREGAILVFCKILGVHTIMHLHAGTIDQYLNHKIQLFLFCRAISAASSLAVLTPWWQNRLDHAQICKPVFVVPNPLPLKWEERANLQRDYSTENTKLIILCVTRIVPGKGVRLLLDTMPLLPKSVHLFIAGDGNRLNQLKQQTKKLQLDSRVTFSGWVTGKVKQQLFDLADLFCLPSSYDSFGMGYIEAMANGLPVIALNHGPIADVVPNEKVGILLDESTSAQLAAAIHRLSNPALRERMGKNGQQWVLESFAAKKISKKLSQMFKLVTTAC